MANNNYSWNQTLKFSFGHIIAFVALIFISYVTYMGDFYQNGGDFNAAAIKVCLIDVALLITFIGAQQYKGANEKFDRSVKIERVLIFLCPIAFIWAMIPFNHFWTVFSEREQIESHFNTAIENSRKMFEDYEEYSNNRLQAYENTLDNVIINQAQDTLTYINAGFVGSNDEIVEYNYIETLELQLLSENTDSLCQSALAWIDNANQGASVWNAFLVGNIKNISKAIKGWNEQLNEVSKPVLSNETILGDEILPFDDKQEAYIAANNQLNALSEIYTSTNGVSLNTIWLGLILFAMLLFPYFIQNRNEKAKGYYSLLPNRKTQEPEIDYIPKPTDSTPDNNGNDDPYSGTF